MALLVVWGLGLRKFPPNDYRLLAVGILGISLVTIEYVGMVKDYFKKYSK